MLKRLSMLALLTLTWLSPAAADCLKDSRGEIVCGAGACSRDQRGDVYCAALRLGSAFRARDGWVVCGRGQCTVDRRGEYICSDVEGGTVQRQSDGTVRCEGRCEIASSEWCERSPAGR